MTVVERFEFNHGIVAKVLWDDDIEPDIYNPREWENVGKMLCAHRNYILGDEQIKGVESEAHLMYMIAERENMTLDCNTCGRPILCDAGYDDYEDWYHADHSEHEDLDPEVDYACEGVPIEPVSVDIEWMPLYLFDHSGISMSTSDAQFRMADSAGWDWGTVGIIYTTRKVMEQAGLLESEDNELTWQPKARRIMAQEVETYDLYLTGQCYGYVIEDAEGEQLDSCWGFLGDDSVADEAKESAEYFVKKFDEVQAAAMLSISQSE